MGEWCEPNRRINPQNIDQRISVMKQIIVITGPSSGFGALAPRALADAGHIVYPSRRETTGRNPPQGPEAAPYPKEHRVDLSTVSLHVPPATSPTPPLA